MKVSLTLILISVTTSFPKVTTFFFWLRIRAFWGSLNLVTTGLGWGSKLVMKNSNFFSGFSAQSAGSLVLLSNIKYNGTKKRNKIFSTKINLNISRLKTTLVLSTMKYDRNFLLGRCCPNTEKQTYYIVVVHLDFLFLSPVFPKNSKFQNQNKKYQDRFKGQIAVSHTMRTFKI